jgi:hypothetical protein
VTVTPPIAVLCHSTAAVDGIPTVSGTVDVHLDDGRCLQTRQADLLAAMADLAQHRPVVDEGCDLVVDPLPAPSGTGLLVLQLRLGSCGDEIGTRHTTSAALDGALATAWQQVQRYAQRTDDRALLEELLIPHAEHYCPPARILQA